MRPTRLVRLVGLTLLLGVAGCGLPHRPVPAAPSAAPPPAESAAPTSSRLPPRPAELRLDGVDPCALLTTAEQAKLGVHQVYSANDADQFRSLGCQWDNGLGPPDNAWVARAIVKQGADYALDNQAPVQVVQIDGYSAVQTSSPYQNPNRQCIQVIDVAQGESLWVQYDDRIGTYPGINHEVACQQARKAAELMIHNLRTLAH
jgi:Protein of unknown function (DUF3558)